MNDSEQKASNQDSRFMTISKFAWDEKAQQVKELQSKVEEMQKALEWYADEKNYEMFDANVTEYSYETTSAVWEDEGERARQALKGLPNDL